MPGRRRSLAGRVFQDALLFVARRLDAEGIVILFAARDGDGRRFESPQIPDLALGALDLEAAAALVARRSGRDVAAAVCDLLVEQAGGNALALVELPAAFTPAQLAGEEPLPEALPLPRDVERLFLERVRRLPEPSQGLLLVVPADDEGSLAPILRAAERVGIDADALAAAEHAGLVSVQGTRVDVRHPLVRSAVYQAATFAQRRLAHQALAASLDVEESADRRVWHLAAAAVGPDDGLADELEESAERARRRSGFATAAAALERAAELTSQQERCAQRLAAAAGAAWLGGRAETATSLLERARRLASEPLTRADIDHVRALIELERGSPARAHELLLAARRRSSLDPSKASELLAAAGEAAAFAGDLREEIEAGRRAARLRERLPGDRFELTTMAGIADLLEGDVARGAPLLARRSLRPRPPIARAGSVGPGRPPSTWAIWR